MATIKQQLGELGEKLVATKCSCPKCKRKRTLRRLPVNFKCADVICDFCGYLAQVKTASVKDSSIIPKTILGAAWSVQKERMDSGIFFPLFLVLKGKTNTNVYYLPADLQIKEMFIMRNPLSSTARRAGWQGFFYDTTKIPKESFLRLL